MSDAGLELSQIGTRIATRVRDAAEGGNFFQKECVALSVKRHRDATRDETWAIGFQVVAGRDKILLGRADFVPLPVKRLVYNAGFTGVGRRSITASTSP